MLAGALRHPLRRNALLRRRGPDRRQPGGGPGRGRANGMNRIAIVIPCHRVVNKSGELGGYGGGLWRKRRLLHLEQRAALLG